MKLFVKVLAVVTLIAVLFAGYVVWASDAALSYKGYQVESAADRIEAFNGVAAALQSGDAAVTGYNGALSVGAAEDYVFVTYTLKVTNRDVVPFEWLDIQLDSQEEDVLLVNPTVQDVPALSSSLVSFTLLTSRTAASYARTATLTYYVYGHAKTAELTLG